MSVAVISKKSDYRIDPGDDLPARVVRSWSRRKHHYLERYAQIFSVGMKKWERRTYVDLFAGPGRCYEGLCMKVRVRLDPLAIETVALGTPGALMAYVIELTDGLKALGAALASLPEIRPSRER